MNHLRKERINASNLDQHQQVSKTYLVHNQQTSLLKSTAFLNQQDKQLQLRSSFNSSKKLLIPVSAAAATSKKTNQQILVVPTPDGGARLAASTNASTARSTLTTKSSSFTKNSNGFTNSSVNSLLSSSNKSTQFNNFTITNTTKPIITTLSNSLNLKNARIVNDRSSTTTTTNSLPNELMTITTTTTTGSSAKRKQPLGPVIADRSSLLFKDHTASSLIAKLEPKEPKIDEAKAKEEFLSKLGLVTKQALSEIQNKKSERKRRTTANPQFSNAAIEAKRITAQELAAKKANRKRELAASNQDNLLNSSTATNKRSFLNSNRGKQVAGKQSDAKKNMSKVSNKQFNQTNEPKITSYCFVCEEVCDSDLDEIMFCQDCYCLFHVSVFICLFLPLI